MRGGYRRPSVKKSVKSRTSGRVIRTARRSVTPGYGKKGMGWAKDPKRAAYNSIYGRTTQSVRGGVSGDDLSCGCTGCGCMSLIFIFVLLWRSIGWLFS